jgi:hypothetical protein
MYKCEQEVTSFADSSETRTKWAERFAAEFTSKPLVAEWVFSNPQFIDGRSQKEVCDLIFLLRNRAIVVQQKCQEDPTSRSGARLDSWVIKQAEAGVSQLRGALNTIQSRDFWCDHPRRGRVDFKAGDITPIQGVVLVEHFSDHIKLSRDCDLQIGIIPVAYMTPNDFLNTIAQFRAFADIGAYLSQRAALPHETRTMIGGEQLLFQYYVEHGGTFEGWQGYDVEAPKLRQRSEDFAEKIRSKMDADYAACYLEYVADCLATRDPQYSEGLSDETLRWFEQPELRKAYLEMQQELCDLRLPERRMLGEYFLSISRKADASLPGAPMYGRIWLDSKPEFLYVFASARGVPRQKLLDDCRHILALELTRTGKRSGMLIVDCDSERYHVVFLKDFVPNDSLKAAAGKLQTLREYDVAHPLVP